MKTLKKVKKRAIKLPGKVEYTGSEPSRKGSIYLTRFEEGSVDIDHKTVAANEITPLIKDGATCWISLDSISDSHSLQELGKVLGVHHLFVSDMANADHQPKLHISEKYIFLTLKGLHFNGNGVETEHLSLILGKGFVVSISEREKRFFEEFRTTYLGETSLWNSTPDFLFSLLIDFVVTGYFAPISKVEEELSSAFTLYKGTFPDRQIPKVYSYVAGFNQSMMLADGALGIGLDKYLGADYKNYPSMGFPRYILRKMTVEHLPVDAMYAWASGEFPIRSASEPLLSHMVYQGKLMYLVSQMMPNVTDTLLFGFTKKQMKWVKNNEKMMWEVLIGQKLLFNTEQMVATKMVGEAPFTTIYSPDSPGKAAVWQGFRIVSSYMKNTGSTLDQLMKEDDFQKILDLAKYKP